MTFYFPPLDLIDASILLAISAILLLITAQISPTFYGLTDFRVEKKKLDNAAIIAGLLFLATVVIKIVGIMLGY
ncbi:MAG: hypothetical protein EHM25_11110 [Nitrosopumilales archaeon]|nr:MAG: hypothetical protein EHM25_11110 [Nitrosopumilales archaeon]